MSVREGDVVPTEVTKYNTLGRRSAFWTIAGSSASAALLVIVFISLVGSFRAQVLGGKLYSFVILQDFSSGLQESVDAVFGAFLAVLLAFYIAVIGTQRHQSSTDAVEQQNRLTRAALPMASLFATICILVVVGTPFSGAQSGRKCMICVEGVLIIALAVELSGRTLLKHSAQIAAASSALAAIRERTGRASARAALLGPRSPVGTVLGAFFVPTTTGLLVISFFDTPALSTMLILLVLVVLSQVLFAVGAGMSALERSLVGKLLAWLLAVPAPLIMALFSGALFLAGETFGAVAVFLPSLITVLANAVPAGSALSHVSLRYIVERTLVRAGGRAERAAIVRLTKLEGRV